MMLLAVALAALVLAHVMRAVRHATLFPAGRRPRTFHLAVGLSLAYVVDTVVPLRVGELVRAVYVSLRAGQGLGRVLATIVFERMSDLFAVALILLVLPRVVAGAPHTSALVLGAMAGAAAVVVAAAVLLRVSRGVRRAMWSVASIFNDRIRLSLVDAAWTVAQLVATTPRRNRAYLLLTAPMWATYLAAYALIGRATGLGFASVLTGLLARPLSALVGASALDRVLLLFASIAALAVLVAGLLADGSGIQRSFRLALRVGLPDEDNDAGMSRETFARDEDYGAILSAHFTEQSTAAAGFGLHGLDGAVVQRLLPGGSDALTAVVEAEGAFVIRKFAMGAGSAKLAEQADWLRRHSDELPLAEVIAERAGDAKFRYDMPYLASAHDLYEMVHVLPVDESRRLLGEVVDSVDRWHRLHNGAPCDAASFEAYVEGKVVANARNVLDFARLQLPERYAINDERYALSEWERLLEPAWVKSQMRERATGAVHGDLTIENIIVCPERGPGWYLIDPNPSNHFDTPLIDWAKLMQSLNLGYEALDRGPPARVRDGHIHLMLSRSNVYAALHDELDRQLARRLGPDQRRDVAFHEIVNYLRLIPYKMRNPPAKAMTFFACASILLRRYEELCFA